MKIRGPCLLLVLLALMLVVGGASMTLATDCSKACSAMLAPAALTAENIGGGSSVGVAPNMALAGNDSIDARLFVDKHKPCQFNKGGSNVNVSDYAASLNRGNNLLIQ